MMTRTGSPNGLISVLVQFERHGRLVRPCRQAASGARRSNLTSTLIFVALALGVLLTSSAMGDERALSGKDADMRDRFNGGVRSIASARVVIGYKVASDGDSLTGTALWYTRDRGRAWKKANLKDAVQNPIIFDTPEDGLYGFFLVLSNAAGSTPEPRTGDTPHRWVRVDRDAPFVQILNVTPDARFDLNREIHVRWSVRDAGLSDRPVSLHYRTEQTKTYRLIADSLAAESSRRWTVPKEASGRLEIKASAFDRAGNRGESVVDWYRIEGDTVVRTESRHANDDELSMAEISDNPASSDISQAGAEVRPSGIHHEPDAGQFQIGDGGAKEAARLYDLGTWHRLRGEHDVSIARYREALKQRPDFHAARNDLAGVLYLQGDLEQAEAEYRRVLESEPKHRSALKGLALVQAKQRNYRSAQQTLDKLLLVDPNDAEAWLHFGDVCMFMADRRAARDAWTKANGLESSSPEIAKRAAKRLEIYRLDRLIVDGGG